MVRGAKIQAEPTLDPALIILLLEYWTTFQPKSLLRYDYAIIALKIAFTLNKYVSPICLHLFDFDQQGDHSPVDDKFEVSGWGNTYDQDEDIKLTRIFVDGN